MEQTKTSTKVSKHLPMTVRVPIEDDNPAIVRDEALCIRCGMCKDVCTDAIGIHGTYSLSDTDDTAVCIHCGQCANVCPVSSITERMEYRQVQEAILNPQKIVIFSTSPSVRVALGEEFGMEDGAFVQGKMITLLRKLGADYVLDTNFAADLTIVEEASELIERITKKTGPLPQFTSCCPAWVKYAQMYHPELTAHISSAKSPIGMQGPTIKTYFAKKMGIDPKQIVNIAVTPCTAKKYEIRRDEMDGAARYLNIDGMRDMDHVITTRELALWAKEESISFSELEDGYYDSLMGQASGAGVIFGNSGGVMEAALRTAYTYITKQPAPQQLYELEPVRGLEGIKTASFKIQELEINVAVIYGTANAEKFIQKMQTEGKEYHFIEVMTCPGGCIGGGGQPKGTLFKGDDLRKKRTEGLYKKDSTMKLRNSHENEEIIALYEEFYKEPLSDLAKQLLHMPVYEDWSYLLGDRNQKPDPIQDSAVSIAQPSPEENVAATPVTAEEGDTTHQQSDAGERWRCKICGYIHEGPLPENFVCPICAQPTSEFERIS